MTLRMPRQEAAILTAAYHMHSFVVVCLGDNFLKIETRLENFISDCQKYYLAGEISNANGWFSMSQACLARLV